MAPHEHRAVSPSFGLETEKWSTASSSSKTDAICVYCGMPGTTDDHVVPRSFTSRLSDVFPPLSRPRGEIVPCCSECNTLLGNVAVHTVNERRKVVHQKLRRRYRKLLASPDWSPNEINSLAPSLRGAVAEAQEHKESIQERLRWEKDPRPMPKPRTKEAGRPSRVQYSDRLRDDILTLRKRGLVPLAIADILDISDLTVARHIASLVKAGALEVTPRYLEQQGPDREIENCPHCGKVING